MLTVFVGFEKAKKQVHPAMPRSDDKHFRRRTLAWVESRQQGSRIISGALRSGNVQMAPTA
jgi:hypothetical protein